MNKKENKLANIGCLTVLLISVLTLVIIHFTTTESKQNFEIVSELNPSSNSKIICIYTDCEDFTQIKDHAEKTEKTSAGSIAIFYYNDKNKIPDISKSGYIISDRDHKNAIATYKKYGKNQGQFLIK